MERRGEFDVQERGRGEGENYNSDLFLLETIDPRILEDSTS